MILYVANALHQSDPQAVHVFGLTDGYKLPITPQNHPLWDTMLTLLNQEDVDVIARWTFWHEQTGQPVVWPETGLAYQDELLYPHRSWAVSFIPMNGWGRPPQDWMGFGTVEFFRQTPFGLVPLPADAEVYGWILIGAGNFDERSPAIEVPCIRQLEPRTEWAIAYAIPHYEDGNHSGPRAYVTGLHFPNFDSVPAELEVRYTVNQRYNERGQSWSFPLRVEPKHAARFDLGERLRAVGYPADLNSEGHVEIVAKAPVRLFPNAAVAIASYVWSAGQGFCR